MGYALLHFYHRLINKNGVICNRLQYTSVTIERAVEALSAFPGIGKRTAMRLVMHLLQRPENEITNLADSLIRLKTELKLCEVCGTVSDFDKCSICNDPNRKADLICVVEDFYDLMAIENTAQYRGLYHVLGGLISPLDGVGPESLNIDKLLNRAAKPDSTEIIMAFSATIEGDTTMFYLAKKLKTLPVKVSCIARGISVGGELEYADELTLARSLNNRTDYQL